MAGTWLATVCSGSCCTPPCTYTICARVETCLDPTDNDGVLIELLSGGSPIDDCTTAESINEVQQLKVTDEPPSAGNFKFRHGGVTSSTSVASNATASQVTTCLNTISALNGNVSCTGGPLVTAINIEFINALAGTNVALIEVVPGTSGSFGIVGVTDGAGGAPGSCCFSGLAAGTYQLRASKTGYVTQTTASFTVSVCSSTTITIWLVNATADVEIGERCCNSRSMVVKRPDATTLISTTGAPDTIPCAATDLTDVDIEGYADGDHWPITYTTPYDIGLNPDDSSYIYLVSDAHGCRSFSFGPWTIATPVSGYIAPGYVGNCPCHSLPDTLDYSDPDGSCSCTWDGASWVGSFSAPPRSYTITIHPVPISSAATVQRVEDTTACWMGGINWNCATLPSVSVGGFYNHTGSLAGGCFLLPATGPSFTVSG